MCDIDKSQERVKLKAIGESSTSSRQEKPRFGAVRCTLREKSLIWGKEYEI